MSVYGGWFDQQVNVPAGKVVEDVVHELPQLSGIPGSTWTVDTLEWKPASQAYEIVATSAGSPNKWFILYDPAQRKVLRSEKR